MSKYQISFVPKKSGSHIRGASLEPLSRMISITSSFINGGHEGKLKKGTVSYGAFNHVMGLIRHCSSTLIEGEKVRTICAPSEELKCLQRAILSNLSRIPVHNSAHGFVRGRDSMTCAMAHTEYWGDKASRLVVLNMDAKNFFHSVTSGIVRKSLEAHGVKPGDADGVIASCMVRADEALAISVLRGLSHLRNRSTDTDLEVIIHALEDPKAYVLPDGFSKKVAFAICQGFLSLGHGVNMVNKFLPQGAPTSPCLSNLAMKIVDIRLSAMAKSFGGFYTRYADDLTVSWKIPTKGKTIDSMYRCTNLVLNEYSIILNRSKKRVMGGGKRQDIVGFCINSGKPTISKQIRRRIRAAVHNEVVRGSLRFKSGDRRPDKFENHDHLVPGAQRVSYLMGHIGRLVAPHPKEAEKYRGMLEFAMNRTEQNMHPFKISEDVFEELKTE